ncbi:hypothetical protein FSP39_016011 [Pinctada imbricata]|uniref:Uncharacterized protein n=1 Tax=Pinctada imbricata TaxID=66713 RepID=A0AA88YJK6_PINIB|nr:hypothetical protein FSP39_016011 [Pinctada imbricata]
MIFPTVMNIFQDYSMSFYFRQSWTDLRLRYNFTNVDVLEIDTKMISDLWLPDVYIINEKRASFHDITVPNKLINIYPDGRVFYSARITGTFTCSMDLHKYPLDRQICDIKFESLNYTCVGLKFYLERNKGYYITQIYVPSILVIILSWVNFWLSVEAVPARISLGLLTVLTMSTQSASALSNLQKISYVKALDVWLAVCLAFVFGALIEFAYVNVTARVEQRRKMAYTVMSKFLENRKKNKEEDYSMSFYFRQIWTDYRLRYNFFGVEVLELDTKIIQQLWVPDVYVINEKRAIFHDITLPNKLINIYPDGKIFYSSRFSGTFSCNMELYKYPLDRQICDIQFQSYAFSENTIVIRWQENASVINRGLELPQFNLTRHRPFICDETFNGVDAVPARISLGLLTVLTMTTQSAAALKSLHKVSYITALDVWLAVCLIFVFAAFIEFAYVNVTARVEQRRKFDIPVMKNKEKVEIEIHAYCLSRRFTPIACLQDSRLLLVYKIHAYCLSTRFTHIVCLQDSRLLLVYKIHAYCLSTRFTHIACLQDSRLLLVYKIHAYCLSTRFTPIACLQDSRLLLVYKIHAYCLSTRFTPIACLQDSRPLLVYKIHAYCLSTRFTPIACLQDSRLLLVYKIHAYCLSTRFTPIACLQDLRLLLVYKIHAYCLSTRFTPIACLQDSRPLLVYKIHAYCLSTRFTPIACLQDSRRLLVYKIHAYCLSTRFTPFACLQDSRLLLVYKIHAYCLSTRFTPIACLQDSRLLLVYKIHAYC